MDRVAALLVKLRDRGSAVCIVEGDRGVGCDALRERVAHHAQWLGALAPGPGTARSGTVIGLAADYSVDSIALLLAAWSRGHVVVLLPPRGPTPEALLRDGCVTAMVRLDVEPAATDSTDAPHWIPLADAPSHPLLDELHARGEPGLVVFTSGTSGRPKAVLHSVERLLQKLDAADRPLRTLAVLQFDHIAGLDALLYTLCAGGEWVIPPGRDPDGVCRTIASARVQVLNTSPSFLRLLWASGRATDADLGSVEIVTYGAEPMDPATLERTRQLFPHARLRQKYGTTETGAPRTRSEADGSLRIRLSTDDAAVQVRDGVLWIRSAGRALGYLNAPSPFDADGWYCTGDLVDEGDDGWLQVRGRASELVNVGGEKVSPAAVEQVILELPDVVHVVVHGRAHPLLGQVVAATVSLRDGADAAQVERVVRRHCRDRLPRHAVPVTVDVAEAGLVSGRQKLQRRENARD